MEKKNTGLIVLVVILSLLVVGLGGYIVYDKVLSKEDSNINNDVKDNDNIQNNTDNNENNNTSNDNTNDDLDLSKKLKSVFGSIYDFMISPNPYCGKRSSDDKISAEGGLYYYASTEFSSYQEMIDKFKKYASEEVLTRGGTTKQYYLEKDGKLYCKDHGKGKVLGYRDAFINISEETDNRVVADVIAVLATDMWENNPDTISYYIEDYKVVFEKNSNNEFIITSMENGKIYN